jgi:uncharacterized protein (TIGR03435 family)
LSFEVASVKPNPPGDGRFDIREQPGGRFLATGISLKQLIAVAYRVRNFEVLGGPQWLDSSLWTIEAKAEANSLPVRTVASYLTEPDPTALRIQALLADEFRLKIHREKRESSVYELTVAKDGPRISLSQEQASVPLEWQSSIYAFQLAMGQPVPPPPPPPPGVSPAPAPNGTTVTSRFNGLMFVGRTDKGLKFEARAIPVANLVVFLSQLLNRSVIDRAGLKGLYDIRFEWTPDLRTALPVDTGSAVEPSGPSLFTAIQEQLGLKLVSAKGLVEVIVVDSAMKPERR